MYLLLAEQSRCVVAARNPHQLHSFVQKKAVTKGFSAPHEVTFQQPQES
jgi:hypothetical protein